MSNGANDMSDATNDISDGAFDMSVVANDIWKMTAYTPKPSKNIKNGYFCGFGGETEAANYE